MNNVCDPNLNNEYCCFDGGDCEEIFGNCPDTTNRVGDGICDLDLAAIARLDMDFSMYNLHLCLLKEGQLK